MFQFHIRKYGVKGDGSGATGANPFELILRVVGVAEASPKNIWMKDYSSLANAKTGAAAIFATGTVTPWVDNADASESVSAAFTPTF